MPSEKLLDEILTDVLIAWLTPVIPSSLGEVATPFKDIKIKLPQLFVRVGLGGEVIQNTGIFNCEAQIELRYIVKKTSKADALIFWRAIADRFTSYTFKSLATSLTEQDPENIYVHFVSLTEVEPETQDQERHHTLGLTIGCAEV